MKKVYMNWLIVGYLLLIISSCGSLRTQDEMLAPRRSTDEIRLEDIRQQLAQNPVRAIDLIGSFRETYKVIRDDFEAENLAVLENEATDNLREFLERAIAEERWDDAVSFSRSLANLEAVSARPPSAVFSERDLILAGAKKRLADGENLGAFLAAMQAHELAPLSFDDAMLFLERAVDLKQRRTAACFYAVAEQAGTAAMIPADYREFVRGSDNVTDMLKGVATVVVDRGIRIDRGRGFADRVLGTAFFVDQSGLMITNYHVIDSEVNPRYQGFSRLFIRMGDGSSPLIPARVIGWDMTLDLALLQTAYRPEYIFSVVDRVVPRVGDSVLAMGSPGGLEKTVTSGIISAQRRLFLQIGDVYQIDAAVNPGSSGGPIIDHSGRLVGIAFGGIMEFQGMNFAIPAGRLAAALPAMINGGKADRPWLGMVVNETSAGAEIVYTAPNTPASNHFVPEGSIVTSINGRQITAPQGFLISALQDILFKNRPGELVTLEILTPGGETIQRLVMSVPRPELPLGEAAKVDTRERLVAPLFGMILSPGAGGSRSSFQVRKVVRGSPADMAGISDQDIASIRSLRVFEREGFVVLEINIKRRRMGYLETTMQLLAGLDSPDTL
ncbi:MAG: trypsin-like peptidase domain-containing protein [Treponema sp.]|nr:trypsin-like peptidase domain-containing protein [Treponema sp.]